MKPTNEPLSEKPLLQPNQTMQGQKCFKIALRIAAVGLLVDMLYIGIRSTSFFRNILCANTLLVWDAIAGAFNVLALSCLALVCLTLFAYRKQMPVPDKSLRILTATVAIVTLLLIASQAAFPMRFGEKAYLYFDTWQLCTMLLLAICFLWKLSSMELGQHPLPRLFSSMLLGVGVLLCVCLPLFIVYGVYVVSTEHVLGCGLGTFCYATWLKVFVPVLLLVWYALYITPITKNRLYRLLLWICIIGLSLFVVSELIACLFFV